MRPYEEILNKISPIFYKLLQYHQSYSSELLRKYLWHANVPITNFLFTLRTEDINYYFDVDLYIILSKRNEIIVGMPIYFKEILLTAKNKAAFFKERLAMFSERLTMPEFIVNIIINKFSIENKQVVPSNSLDGLPLPYTLKDLFIALVGKDTYDAIRRNIK